MIRTIVGEEDDGGAHRANIAKGKAGAVGRSERLLVGAATAEDGRDRHEDDTKVAAEREVLDVLPLDGEHLVECQLASARDLPRPRDARLHPQPYLVLRLVALDGIEHLRPRPNDGHFAA